MLPKTSAYVKSYDGKTRWMYLLNIDDDWGWYFHKSIMIFGIKSTQQCFENRIW